MGLKVVHSLIVIITIFSISSLPFCVSSYPFSEHVSTEEHEFDPFLQNAVNYENEVFSIEKASPTRSPMHPAAPAPAPAPAPLVVVNVDDFLSHLEDHNEAFKEAWDKACSSNDGAFVVARNKKYKLKPIKFKGPCKSHITMNISGTIEASNDMSDYEKDQRHWIVFENVHNFRVQGGGTINGNGEIWWENSCKIDKSRPCKHAPTAITFEECKNLKVENIRIENAQQMHLTFQKCVNVIASHLVVSAPAHSPNTDGIHVTETHNIRIRDSVIGTGDDCISIVSGSKDVAATDIKCGPGHGISIGSLGAGNDKAHVSKVLVNRATLTGTTNGVRIKTWQGGSGYAKNIVFENIEMKNVSNPIIIDQNYCDRSKPCTEQKSAVRVYNVEYRNIKGSSASKYAISFDCSKSHPCRNILLDNVDFVKEGDEEHVQAQCNYVKSLTQRNVSPTCNLS